MPKQRTKPPSKAIRNNLLRIARAYAKAKGLSLSTVSHQIYGRGGFFEGLRNGRHTMTLTNLDAVFRRFVERWPAGAPWPEMEPVEMGRVFPMENSP